jgi:hypothetical protein
MLSPENLHQEYADHELQIQRLEDEIARRRRIQGVLQELLVVMGEAQPERQPVEPVQPVEPPPVVFEGAPCRIVPAAAPTPAPEAPPAIQLAPVEPSPAPSASLLPSTSRAQRRLLTYTSNATRVAVRADSAEGRLLVWLRSQKDALTSNEVNEALKVANASNLLSSLYEKGVVERSATRVEGMFLYRAVVGLELPLPTPPIGWTRASDTPRVGSMGRMADQLLELVRRVCAYDYHVSASHPDLLAGWDGSNVSSTLADLWTAGHLERRPATPRGYLYRVAKGSSDV